MKYLIINNPNYKLKLKNVFLYLIDLIYFFKIQKFICFNNIKIYYILLLINIIKYLIISLYIYTKLKVTNNPTN